MFFWQQNYYALITAANGRPAEAAFAKELAKALAAKLPAGKLDIPALKWFPTQDLVPGTITWIKDKALGQEWLNDVYTAKYKVAGQELQAFCARRDKPADAAALAGKYRDYLKTAGQLSDETVDGVKLTIADQHGMFDIIYAKGSTFGGVTYTDQRAAATKLAARLAAAAP